MPSRKAEAEWKGNLIQGSGRLAVGSGAFDGPYSFKSRMEDGQSATNPEASGKGSPLRVHQRPRLRFRVGPPLEQISCTAESATFRKAARG